MSSTPIDPLRPVSALILPSRNTAIRSALGYAAAGATWMFSSGWVLHRLVLDHVWEVRGGVLSGWLFVAVTALLLGFALDRYFRVIRRSARRLQESETRWKQALEGASQAVWDWNLQTSEVFYSTEWKAMLGYQPHELANVLPEWETRVHPDDLPRVREELNRHLAGETPDYASEHRLRCKDGSFKWILDRGKVTSRSSDGKPLRLVGTHSDIHRRKQAEERNRIQHNLMLALAGTNYLDEGLRFCLDAAINADGLTCGGLYLADPKTGTLNLCVHSGLSAEFTKSVARFDPESPQGRVVAAGKPVYAQFEQLRLKQSGAELREGLHSIAILPILRQGEVLGCLNVASRTHDEIPEYARIALETIAASAGEAIARLRVREELRESELNFRTFFDTVDDVIVVTTPDGRILFGNAAVERKLGFSAEELAGMAVPDLHPPERRAEAGEILAAMFRGERQVCPLPLARRDGRLLPVETRVWYGKWNGQPCLFGVCKDLSAEQEAQQRFERLFRLNPLPMALLSGPDRCFQDVNDAWLETLGYEREEVIGRSSTDLGLFPDRAQQQQLADGLREHGTVSNIELRVQTKTGAIRYGLFSGERLHSQGKDYVLTVMLDVTERKHAEEALRQSEEKYRGIFDESVAAIYIFDGEKRFIDSNQAGLELLGYSREELLGKRIPDVDADPEAVLPAHRQLLTGGRLGNFEHHLRRKDGTVVTVLNNSRPLTDAHGNVSGVQSTLVDITEQKRAQSELRQWADAFEHCAHGIALGVPGTNRVMTCNPAFARMLGRTVEEVSGQQIRNLYVPEDHERLRQHIVEADRTGLVRYESRMVRADGSIFPVQMDVASVRDADGHPVYRVATAQDISERKQAEAAFREQFELQDQLAKVAASVPGLIYSFRLRPDGSACMPFATAALTGLCGLQPEDVREDFSPVLALVHPDDRDHLQDSIAESARTLQPWHDAFRARHPRKGEIWIEGTSVPRLEADGSILWHGFLHDVTEYKQAEHAIKAAQELFQSLFQLSPTAYSLANLSERKIVDVNAAWEELFGYSRAEVVGRPATDFDSWQHPEERLVAHRKLLEDGRLWEHEFELKTKSGAIRHVAMYASMVELAGEKYVFSVFIDLTGRKQAEEALRRSDAHLRTLVNTLPDLVWLKDPQGVYLACNARFESFFGASAAGIVGKTDYDFQDRERAGSFRANDAAAVAAGGPRMNEEEVTFASDGHREVLETIKTPMFDADGTLIGVLGISRNITGRKQAEEALRNSESLLRQVGQMAKVGGWQFDIATGEGSWTEEVARIHDLTPGTPSNKVFGLSFYQGESRQRIEAAIERAATEGVPYDLELELESATGAHKWVHTIGQAVTENGRIAKLRGAFQDITERKRAEARAARDASRTEFLLELHQRAPQMTDKELYEHVLERAVQLTGSSIGFFHQISEDQNTVILTAWSQEALKNCTASFHGHYPLREAGNWVDCVREQRPVIYNDYVHSPNQRGLPAGHAPLSRFMSIPVVREGKVWVVFGVGNKATDYDEEDVAQLQVVANEIHKLITQRLSQRQLRESEERFRQLVETSYDWIWEVDADGRFTYASPKVEDLLGHAPADVLGRTPFDLMPEAEAKRVKDTFAAKASRREAFTALENVNLHKDGREVVLETSGVPVLGPNGELLGYRGMDRDITERKRAESERERLHAQLAQSQKMESIGRLAGGVAHDFNNLLTVINGYSELAVSAMQPGDPLRSQIEEVLKAGERATGLTRQLLAFSRKQVMQPRTLKLNGVIAEMQKMLQRLVGEDVDVRLILSPEDPVVHADPSQIEQVIMNLAVNARDAMPRGGRLLIETTVVERDESYARQNPDAKPGRYVQLAISDTGVGMDQATQKRMFEPFFTTKPSGQGTGLGLSMVHGIVVQSGGHINVYSEPGHGTSFKIYLPTVTRPKEETDAPRARLRTLRGNETILVVEDQADVRDFAVAVLKAYGYRVMQAPTASEALLVFEHEGDRIDLLLTDVVMPNMSGRQLAERVLKARPDIKVLFMSGYMENVIVHHGILDEGVTLIQKPFSPEELASKVRAVLGPAAPMGRILVVDQDRAVRSFLRTVLEAAGYEVSEAKEGSDAVPQAQAQGVDLVIADLVSPEQEGPDPIQVVQRRMPGVGIIAIAGASVAGFPGVGGMLGADAVLNKPVTPERLLATVADQLLRLRGRRRGPM